MNKAILMGRKWTLTDTELLKIMYPICSNKDLAYCFNRTLNSIQRKATKVGLLKDSNFIQETKSQRKIGEKCNWWKGGRKITLKGYVQISKRGYEGVDRNGYIFEHRYIMEQHLGRKLLSNEIVHHINGNKQDNRIENLRVMANECHTALHNKGTEMSQETRQKISQKAKERRCVNY